MRLVGLILLMMILQGCFPGFTPEEKIVKEMEQGDMSIKWVKVIVGLD